jgi:hypothetical protein
MELRGLIEISVEETREYCSGKTNGALKRMIWRPGENHATIGEQQQQEKKMGNSESKFGIQEDLNHSSNKDHE